MTEIPGVSVEKEPSQVTGLTPPGNPPLGTKNANPARKVFPARPDDGTVVIHVLDPGSKLVVAVVAVGEKVILALGTSKL